jgi:hypothetical protein
MANSRRAIATELLKLQKKLEPALLAIDGYKEQLRAWAKDTGEGFTEEVEGLGTVEVKAGREAELKGTCPELVVEEALKLPAGRLKKLIDSGLIKMAEVWSKKASPSVTVRL